RIGRPWKDSNAEMPTERLARLIHLAEAICEWLTEGAWKRSARPNLYRIDADGFRHFSAMPTNIQSSPKDWLPSIPPHLVEFMNELEQAAERDINGWKRR